MDKGQESKGHRNFTLIRHDRHSMLHTPTHKGVRAYFLPAHPLQKLAKTVVGDRAIETDLSGDPGKGS